MLRGPASVQNPPALRVGQQSTLALLLFNGLCRFNQYLQEISFSSSVAYSHACTSLPQFPIYHRSSCVVSAGSSKPFAMAFNHRNVSLREFSGCARGTHAHSGSFLTSNSSIFTTYRISLQRKSVSARNPGRSSNNDIHETALRHHMTQWQPILS